MKAVFSDLDGTILDFNTYSYDEAREGMNLLKERGIPLIPVSSKTLIEMKGLHRELQLSFPFVFENGGGIAFPEEGENSEDYKTLLLGESTDVLKSKW
ncbi:MAG: HAD hydrolase family protein, partial [bacterium]|nr:HAD hydrolase family protein [bacterium]